MSWKHLIVALVIGAALPALAAGQPMALDDVIKLVDNDISDAVIIAQIEQTDSYFALSTDDIIKLKEAQASTDLINYLITRKPGSAGNGGNGESVRTGGRVSDDDGAQEPPKFGDVAVNVAGKYVVTSPDNLNVVFAAYVDGERKYWRDQWTKIITLTTAETGETTKKWILEPGAFSFKVPAGNHTLTLACWSGRQAPDDGVAKGSVVYTKQLTVADGGSLTLNLAGETDAGDRFVITP
jgi:hypothetical protein